MYLQKILTGTHILNHIKFIMKTLFMSPFNLPDYPAHSSYDIHFVHHPHHQED